MNFAAAFASAADAFEQLELLLSNYNPSIIRVHYKKIIKRFRKVGKSLKKKFSRLVCSGLSKLSVTNRSRKCCTKKKTSHLMNLKKRARISKSIRVGKLPLKSSIFPKIALNLKPSFKPSDFQPRSLSLNSFAWIISDCAIMKHG